MSASQAIKPDPDVATISVLPGDYKVVGSEKVFVSTLLGSCVAACIRDRKLGCGGLNHFLLPEEKGSGSGYSARYGVHAMEVLINSILGLGANKHDLEAKVFGGGAIIESSARDHVGKKNAEFVMQYLKSEQIDVVASDLGGTKARRIFFQPCTGLVHVNRLPGLDAKQAGLRERNLQKAISSAPKTGGVELF